MATKSLFSHVIFIIEVKYYNNDLMLPIFHEGKTLPCETKSIAELLTSKKIPTELIATATPVYVKSNVEFVVDRSYLGDWRDIKTDIIIGMVRSATKHFIFRKLMTNLYRRIAKLTITRQLDMCMCTSPIATSIKLFWPFQNIAETSYLLPLFYVQCWKWCSNSIKRKVKRFRQI